jgi:Arc/MetJ-type ribon-helix-helix transcriptional regulator
MAITLTPEQQQWLEMQVAAGRFASIEDAVRMAVADFKTIHTEDLSWAKPYIDQSRQSVARGEIVSGDQFLKRLDAHLEALRTS